jgi:hypothetical protein
VHVPAVAQLSLVHASLSSHWLVVVHAGVVHVLLQHICPVWHTTPPHVTGSFLQYDSQLAGFSQVSIVVVSESLHCALLEQLTSQSAHWPVHGLLLVQCCPLEQFASMVHSGVMHAPAQHICALEHFTSAGQFEQFSPLSGIVLPQLARQSLSVALVHVGGQ